MQTANKLTEHSRHRGIMKTAGSTIKRYVLTIVMALAVLCAAAPPSTAVMDISQTISDGAQRTTLAFSGLAMMTGNLDAQSFYPPGKVADYTGFQYLRDNDPDNMGHNTSFLTRVANNVIHILNDSQLAQLADLATAQQEQFDLYGYKRFPLMKAFRRLMDGDIPTGATGLDLAAVKKASRELYLIDGQISFDRALLYATIIGSLNDNQTASMNAMKGKGWSSWPDITDDQIKDKMKGLPQGSAVAVMTYASDIFSWYAGSVEADVYFCPERQGTYYGGFYIKDAPAIGHEGYSIDEQLTATAGSALCDSAKGYVTQDQATVISSLVATQKNNLYAGTSNIVGVRTQIATLLRSLLASTASSDGIKTQVLDLSGTYGDLDGENNYNYATVFAQVYKTLTADQKTKLTGLRQDIMSGTYADGTPFDFSVCATPFLYSSVIADTSVLDPYISDTDYLFGVSDNDTSTKLYPSSARARAMGRVGMIRVADATGSTWTPVSNDDWIKILWQTKHTGNGWVLYHVSANPGASRTGAMTIAGAQFTVNQKANPFFKGSFSLTIDAGIDNGTLPADYTCDGSGSSPALSWSNAPEGTREFALMMTTLTPDGSTDWSWVLYGIPATTTSLAKNTSGVGTLGVSHRSARAYEPPCSQGPGAKLYTFTLYALSASPQLPDAADQVTGDVLTKAISSFSLASASLNLSYTRP